MGGAFNSTEDGGTCDFSFYTVESQFQLFSVGFRCCFDDYPDLVGSRRADDRRGAPEASRRFSFVS
jgi:hypothetical protein